MFTRITANNILIIVPAFNEAKNLERFLPRLFQAAQVCGADIVGINDASNDRTKECFESHNIPVLSHCIQMGYGTTLQTGYKYAHKQGYRYVVQLDGDGQHDPRFIPAMVNILRADEADVTVGSRFLPHTQTAFEPSERLYQGTFVRKIGIAVFRTILSMLCFRSISDPTSGYLGLNRNAVAFFCGKGFPFDYPDADMILTLIRNGFRIREIPVYMYWNETNGVLHRGCKPLWYVVKVSLALFVASLRRKEVKHG